MTVTTAPSVHRSAPVAIIASMRPRQWVKNVLVFAAAGAGGVIGHRVVFVHLVGALVAMCLATSGTYLVNDVADVERDRAHPVKRFRPVAAGDLSPAVATTVGIMLMAAALVIGWATRWQLGVVVLSYLLLTAAYSIWLKHLAVVDIVTVAAGFVLRAIAGAAAAEVPISNWFFIVTSFGSLFVVTGKRGGENKLLERDAPSTRATLAAYTPSFEAYLRSLTSAVVLVSYCLWAFEKAAVVDPSIPWYQISILPFACAILRYAQLLDSGEGSAPEDLFLHDRPLLGLVAAWATVFMLGVYIT